MLIMRDIICTHIKLIERIFWRKIDTKLTYIERGRNRLWWWIYYPFLQHLSLLFLFLPMYVYIVYFICKNNISPRLLWGLSHDIGRHWLISLLIWRNWYLLYITCKGRWNLIDICYSFSKKFVHSIDPRMFYVSHLAFFAFLL